MNSSLSCYIADIVSRFMNSGIIFFFCWMMACPAFAAESGTASPGETHQNGKRFGVISHVKGDVVAESDTPGQARPLREGSLVYVGEHIRSGVNSEAVINVDDGGVVALRPKTLFIPERFAANGKKTDNMTLRLLVGSLRVITGWIGRVNRAEDRVVTQTATIGIRGTDHEPYVLPADLAQTTKYSEGTYDKVNRGKTALGEGNQVLEINAGRVGFAPSSAFQSKGLMTILMPVLLDKVPDFYVPGEFDAELDKFSKTAEKESKKQLEKKRKENIVAEAKCSPTKIARNWINSFDSSVVKRDAPAVLDLFSPDVAVKANVRKANGEMTTVDLGREELVKSTIAAVGGLKHYSQRRLTLEAEQVVSDTDASCDRISLRSSVIEQGEQSGKPFRFESTEDYVLELREGKWLAVKAETTQR